MTYYQPSCQDTPKGKRIQELTEWVVFFSVVISSGKTVCVQTEKEVESRRGDCWREDYLKAGEVIGCNLHLLHRSLRDEGGSGGDWRVS